MIVAYHMLYSRYRKEAVGDKKNDFRQYVKYKSILLRLRSHYKLIVYYFHLQNSAKQCC